MQMKSSYEAGICIREARKAKGWTQAKFAERMDVTRQWVIRTEKGNDSAELGLIMKAFCILGINLNAEKTTDPSNRIRSLEDVTVTSVGNEKYRLHHDKVQAIITAHRNIELNIDPEYLAEVEKLLSSDD
ncbi:helix-turn-helix domain-containing protein [Acetobacter pasteurianus]|uniref:HTH cro/C1-type domain-containing protein n=1 Tax=Acetobacter pasteurianus NBRC 3188 TaxID=1226663 RepID=A0A401WY46_ACEPA|nr:helix-turn-helix domain-containing protein [Acetobacter pasteurianus]GCD54213.1 hypothetical protein NBRC3188_2910 [Acetobacter pasteurianus NBRC 3188]